MDVLVEIHKELNSPNIIVSNLTDLVNQLDSDHFKQWKRRYQRNAKKKETKKKKQLRNKVLREQNKRRGDILAKAVEEWSQQKDKEAQLRQEEYVKNKLRTKEELEERLRNQTLQKNKLKVIVKLERLRLLRLSNSMHREPHLNNKTLLSKINDLQQINNVNKASSDINEEGAKTSEFKDNEEESIDKIGSRSGSEENDIIKFYNQAYSSIESLIHTRRSWDIYLVNENGYRIPQYFPSEFPLLSHSNWDTWLAKM